MTERSLCTRVTFAHPFEIAGMDGIQPAGPYDLETVEEPIDGLSFLAYRRIATTITPAITHQSARTRQCSTIDPDDLAEAQRRDKETSHGRSQV
jgi:L-alanine-DL-glutamate epimerase-like enolase superfamily enzyme